ncbi:ATP-binding cassette domain-containing protein [Aquisalinus flavus]|uniref:Thiol reductant ABC exporter subunit CydD n=1 Tax=Aquisalinus flavus TaxID=1526572 RepID=A0A8J2Y405_9PROT|nr:ATP-binding cassette domain-containing protein [Aquisalinus flavus]MBD0425887.1 ATP-binding cassette domain-containing protein [Aquisalinus flavus]UNE48517.1 ATP-binding cassette domain-containing protein [Aquisalinus flavus]GGD12465.1 thiol reductant ABC exporter subunit CydD [Aquisalinus flavus]
MKRTPTPETALERRLRGQAGMAARLSLLAGGAAFALRIAMLAGLAVITGALVMDGAAALPIMVAAGACAVGLIVAQRVAARATRQAERDVANRVAGLYRHFLQTRAPSTVHAYDTGDLVSRISRHPGAIASAVITVKNTRSLMAIGPLMAAGLIACLSPAAAGLLVASLPIMIVFFILVGGLTKSRAQTQEAALSQLSGIFGDRIRCLPTIAANHDVTAQADVIGAALEKHRRVSLDVLKVAFLNSAVLDFFSSLSIAMLAIFFGLGHLGLLHIPGFFGLPLGSSLAVLMLAPEFFNPLRRYAELYHVAAEGKAALASMASIDATPLAEDVRLAANGHSTIGWHNLVLPYVGTVPDATLPAKGLVIVNGPSGSGKTTLLRALAGIEPPLAGQILLPVEIKQAWSSSDIYLTPERIRTLYDQRPSLFSGDPRFAGGVIAPETLSGGQSMRLALAAALASDAQVLFIDEPTAKLDPVSANHIHKTLKAESRDRLLVVASHDRALIAAADQVVSFNHRLREVAS